ncbi:hypothetical protein BDV96DRAFT_332668 [Lophiotrema nucula]|uniref:Uncharacterized protein n=1 Tax=Lophiotrema nucula TaxID=690887 RepID=A0A6A5YIG9_9PLEO|nr:hypothetical protein BDV96DRAFT_332668 [Lophiotrema nucula]
MSSKDVEPLEENSDFHYPSEFSDCRSQELRAQATSESSSPGKKRESFVQSPLSTTTLALPSPPLPLDILGDNEPQPHLPVLLPLSTNVVEALSVFQSLHVGQIPAKLEQRGLLRLPLSKCEYHYLFQAIQEDASLRRYKGKFEYRYREESLLIYMAPPLPKHEMGITVVATAVRSSLATLREDDRPEVAKFARRITSAGAPGRELRDFDNNVIDRQPDYSWTFDNEWSAVYEVAFSQEVENLETTLESWILWTYGQVRIAMGLDLSYPNATTAKLYVYEGIMVDGYLTVKKYSHLLRTTPDNLVHTGVLNIPLNVFAPLNKPCDRLPTDAAIKISASQFHAMLAEVDVAKKSKTKIDDASIIPRQAPSYSRRNGNDDDDDAPEPYNPQTTVLITHDRNTRANSKQRKGNGDGNPTPASTTTSLACRRSLRIANKKIDKPRQAHLAR